MRPPRFTATLLLTMLLVASGEAATPAFVRVNQIGYESGRGPYRAYLMSTADEMGASFRVLNAQGSDVFSAPVGTLLGTWSHDASTVYNVWALDFNVPDGDSYTIAVTGPVKAVSPAFGVACPEKLYSGLLLNTRFFYETERDGPRYIRNSLRTAPGHLNDKQAAVYTTPPLDDDDNIATTAEPLHPTGAVIDASGGWWDAGDYMKYVETISYAVALQEIGVRDFPEQLGARAPLHPAAPLNAISYAGGTDGAPASSDFTSEAQFGIDFLLKMWDDPSKTLYYQVANSQDWDNFDFLSDYDIWRLPQADDSWAGCPENSRFICHRPVFRAAPAGARISPNLAGRLAADFATCFELNHETNPARAAKCLHNAENIFELADLSFTDPASSVDAGSCAKNCLLTVIPFDGYPETVWSDDMELGATELYRALNTAKQHHAMPSNLIRTDPGYYLRQATQFAQSYIAKIYRKGHADSLNLYDVSGLAHFELYRALLAAGNPTGLAIDANGMRAQLLLQVDDAIARAGTDTWGFGAAWNSDTTSHGGGISAMASEAFYLTGDAKYDRYAQRWMANILGANAWGSSFIVGDGSATFPNCIQHQVANLAGALNGTSGGTPVLWGASSEGPATSATSGLLAGMLACPADGGDSFAKFNGNSGALNAASRSIYKDNVQSYSTTEPAIDLTASSFLMWAWRLAGRVN